MRKRKVHKEKEVRGFCYTSLEHIRKQIDGLIKEYGKNATLDIRTVPDYGYDRVGVFVEFWREETDEEVEKREKKERHYKKVRKEQYDKLKKEFGYE